MAAAAAVVVRVLGPPAVEGDAGLLSRPKAREAVAYLATHRRRPVAVGRLSEALWPTLLPQPASLAGTLAALRWLTEPEEDRDMGMQLADTVVVDYEQLEFAVNRAGRAGPEEARRLLWDALKLVRGRPLDGDGRGYGWAYSEGLVYEMEATVADAAHRLAELCLDAGDAEGAHWAVRQGLRASPGNEQLYRDQMRAVAATDDMAGVDAAWEELARLGEDPEPAGPGDGEVPGDEEERP
jgi:DNA-binding SARP family transcriptional activator